MNSESTIQKFLRSELSFYITLVSAVLTIAGFYFGITNQIALLTQKVENHIITTLYLPEKVASLSEQIAVLKSKLN